MNQERMFQIIEDMPPVRDFLQTHDSYDSFRCKHCGKYKKYENKPFCSLKCKKAYKKNPRLTGRGRCDETC